MQNLQFRVAQRLFFPVASSSIAHKSQISCTAQFVRGNIAELIDHRYYAIIADVVTDRHSSKEILLVCLSTLPKPGLRNSEDRRNFLCIGSV